MADIKDDGRKINNPASERTVAESQDTGIATATATAPELSARAFEDARNIAGVREDGEFLYASQVEAPLAAGQGALAHNRVNFQAGEAIDGGAAAFRSVASVGGRTREGIAYPSEPELLEAAPDQPQVPLQTRIGQVSDQAAQALFEFDAMPGGAGTEGFDTEGSYTTPGINPETVRELQAAASLS